MSIRIYGTLAGAAALMALVCPEPAHALSMRECSVKYKAAQSAGALRGMKWRDFRRAECGADASAAPAANTGAAPTTAPATPRSAAPSPAGNAVFPTAVSSKYSNESAGKARMHTCLDQYRANKADGGNGDLRWIQKGGGYYSVCNRRLKGG
ncbi:MAG: hypothetical protein GEU91_13880 [Rhizobiales bacterium]|nr:hypothetical protein [Hyphomicrobiales bacterium]